MMNVESPPSGCKTLWPQAEAFTVVEFAASVGVHLHVVVRGTYGLDKAWLDDTLKKVTIDGVAVLVNSDVRLITDSIVLDDDGVYGDSASRVARYLTKQAWKHLLCDDWGAHFHPFSATRKWLPREDDVDDESEEAGDLQPA